MDAKAGEIFTVNNVAEEYAYVAQALCACGGRFQFARQMLQVRGGRYYDIVLARCPDCGATREFIFDIHRFYRPSRLDA